MRRRATLGLVLAALAMSASPAAAQDEWTGNLRLTKTVAYGGGHRPHPEGGLDVRYSVFPTRTPFHFGVFAHSAYVWDAGDIWRFAGGFTIGWAALQLEVGIAHRTISALEAGSTGLQLAKTVLLGPFAISARFTIPLVDYLPENTTGPPLRQGFEAALVVSFGWDLTVHGPARDHSQPMSGGCHHH
jgi:hypothetical protein